MHQEQVFSLLTKEYALVLATNEKDFQVVREVRSDVFSHRYAVYPELKEAEWYLFGQDDKQSFIYLLRHNATGRYVGTVRVYFVNDHTPQTLMPMERCIQSKEIQKFTQNLPVCEISRLNLSHNLTDYKDFSAIRLRTHLSMLLMIATRINFFLYRYPMVFAIMEPSLHRILRRQGVNFEQIGEPVDYYGMRTPFAIERKKLLRETESTMGQITRHYLKALCSNPETFWQFIDNHLYLQREDMQLDRICQLFEKYGDDVELSLLLGEDS